MSFYAMNNEGLKFKDKPKKDVLVVGAGSGYEVISYIKHGHNVRGIDLFAPEIKMVKDVTYIGSADKMPFGDKEFDFVHCTEMMEHVPEEITNDILMECRRVAKRFYFTIATRDDKPYDTHINIHPAWWWIKRFEELGFGIINAQQAARIALNVKGYASVIFWPDGVFLHGNC
uniref:Putative methyltransferase n=1 Tax=viral metagenome TaxID=1070528 RepID=A0A6M3J112_9ZZZZ